MIGGAAPDPSHLQEIGIGALVDGEGLVPDPHHGNPVPDLPLVDDHVQDLLYEGGPVPDHLYEGGPVPNHPYGGGPVPNHPYGGGLAPDHLYEGGPAPGLLYEGGPVPGHPVFPGTGTNDHGHDPFHHVEGGLGHLGDVIADEMTLWSEVVVTGHLRAGSHHP